jgi:hypothetical protein
MPFDCGASSAWCGAQSLPAAGTACRAARRSELTPTDPRPPDSRHPERRPSAAQTNVELDISVDVLATPDGKFLAAADTSDATHADRIARPGRGPEAIAPRSPLSVCAGLSACSPPGAKIAFAHVLPSSHFVERGHHFPVIEAALVRGQAGKSLVDHLLSNPMRAGAFLQQALLHGLLNLLVKPKVAAIRMIHALTPLLHKGWGIIVDAG